MSATNRGAVRNEADFYPTPGWVTRAILPLLDLSGRVLEPAAGEGHIVRELAAGGAREILGIDIRHIDGPARVTPEGWVGRYDRAVGDFLRADPPERFDLIITNPPYSLAREFCERALSLRAPGGRVAMLLRLNFLGSQKRAAWLRANTPSIYVLPKRPSFTGRGTDATEYAWFVWREGERPTVRILDVESERAQGALFGAGISL